MLRSLCSGKRLLTEEACASTEPSEGVSKKPLAESIARNGAKRKRIGAGQHGAAHSANGDPATSGETSMQPSVRTECCSILLSHSQMLHFDSRRATHRHAVQWDLTPYAIRCAEEESSSEEMIGREPEEASGGSSRAEGGSPTSGQYTGPSAGCTAVKTASPPTARVL